MIRATVRVLRYSLYAAGVLLLLAVAALVGLRAWWPNLADHKARIEAYLTDQLGRPVLIQRLEARWDGWSPSFKAGGLRVRRKTGVHSSLRIGGIQVQVNPWSLLVGDLVFERFTLVSPTVELFRTREGGVRIGDLAAGHAEAEQELGYLHWLFRQHDLRVENGTLIWRDERDTAGFLELSSINMNFVNLGDAHQFRGTARCPEPVCANIQITAQLTGAPVRREWGGTIDVELDQVNLGNAPLVVHEMLPRLVRGELNTRISTNWQQGKLVAARAHAALGAAELFLRKDAPLRLIDAVSTDLSWSRTEDGWNLQLSNPSLSFDDFDLALDKVDVSRAGARTEIKGENLALHNLLRVALSIFGEQGWSGILQAADPKAHLRQIAVNVLGPLATPVGVWLETEFTDVDTQPVAKWPGLRGIDGRLSIGIHGGFLTIDGSDGEITWPHQFDQPLRMDALQLQAIWARAPNGWEIAVPNLEVRNEDVAVTKGTGKLLLSGDAPYVDFQAEIPRVDVSRVPRYLPKSMPDKAERWLSRALVAGHGSGGRIQWRGSVDRFPFTAGDGEFNAQVKVNDGKLDYGNRWPPVSQIEADLVFNNASLRVTNATGSVMNSRIRSATALAENLYRRERTIKLDGVLEAKVGDAVDFLRKGPFIKEKDKVMDVAGSGDGEMRLQLMLPLSQLKQSRVEGEYLIQDGVLSWPKRMDIDEIQGTVRFTEDSVSGEGLSARVLQGPMKLDVKTVQPRKPPIFAVDAEGEVDVKRLSAIIGERLVAPLHGPAKWSGRLTVDRSNADLELNSELIGVRADLPPPLGKSADTPMPLTTRIRFAGADRRDVDFDVNRLLTGVLAFNAVDRRWRFLGGDLLLGPGTASLPAARELRFYATADALDVDAWLEVLLREPDVGVDADSESMIDALRRVTLDVDKLNFLERDFGAVTMRAVSEDGHNWEAELDGAAVEGTAQARLGSQQPWYDLELSRLYWPRSEQPAETATDSDREVLPAVTARVRTFRFDTSSLGSLDFEALPAADGWRIAKFRSEQPALLIEADGLWRRTAAGQRTELNVKAGSNDLGKAMAALSLPEQVAGGQADLELAAEWDGAPGAFSFDKLNGAFDFSARKGSFIKVEPGSGRLFGLFNVEALMRRLTFDFSDVFAKGLVFDSINATGTLENGDMFTDGFFVIGPAALIELRGRSGLAKEDYDMEITVAPQLGANLSLLSALALHSTHSSLWVSLQARRAAARALRQHPGSW